MSQSTELLIGINVQDGASAEFRKIGQGAQQMGGQIQKSGERSASTLRKLQDAAKQAGLGATAVTTSFILFAGKANAAERDLRTLDRTYGDTAASLREFGDELQRTTTFSNEQAIAAANVFGTLSRNYGLTADQVQNLITVSADLAAVNGISLTDAAERVQAAIRGEAESAEALGLTMNETAIGLAGVSAGMTEAEKAAFRYNALLEQAAFATGAAAEQAETTTGKVQQMANTVQDVGQDFIRFTYPLGEAAAGLTSFTGEVGLAISGIGAMAPVLKTAGTAVKNLAVAMGPVGLALAAGAAILGIAKLAGGTDDYTQSATKAEEKTLDLMQQIEALALTSVAGSTQQRDAIYLNDILEQYGTNLVENTVSAQDAAKSLLTYGEAAVAASVFVGRLDKDTAELVQSTQAYQDAVNDTVSPGVITYEETLKIVEELNTGYGALVEGAGSAVEAVNLTNQVLTEAASAGVDQAVVLSQIAAAWREFELSGDWNQLITTIGGINTELESVGARTAQTNQILLDLGETMMGAWTSAMDPLRGVNDLLEDIFSSFAPGALAAQQSINGVTGAAETLGRAMAEANGDPRAREGAIRDFYATASAMEILNYELALAGDNQELVNQAFENFAVRVRDAAVGLDEYSTGVERANAAIAQQNAIMASNAGTSSRLAFDRQVDEAKTQRAIANTNRAMAAQEAQMLANGAAAAAYGPVVAANMETAEAVATADAAIAAQQAQFVTSGNAAADYSASVAQAAQAERDLAAEAFAAANSVGALDTSLEQLTAIGAGQTWEYGKNVLQVANDATIAVNALASGFQTLVQNPINWGREAQGVADWATGLMLGADGINSLSDLWGRGQIETITFNRGLEAQNRIQSANADIQNDVARIQAKQLPVMADLIESQAKYIDSLADLDPMNQVIALGYMDTTKAAQAQNLVMLAGAAAAGEYGAMGTEMATNIITAAAQADPVLKAMLIDMGLISEGANGEIDVKFTRAKSLNDDLQKLIASIDALVVALGGIPANTNAAVDVAFRVNGTPMLPNQIGQFGFTMATGGTVTHNVATRTPMYATAATGRTTLVGEAGPELLTLPTGAQVTSAPATADRMSRRTAGGGGGVYFYGPVTLQPSSTDVEQAIRREALAGSRGY